jgi:hypothetical protein
MGFTSSHPKLKLTAIFSSHSGMIQNYKLHDFLSSRNNSQDGNYGKEIVNNNQRGFYLLTNREGMRRDGTDTISAPLEGKYVMKLN